ncbi:glycosyltransferase [Litoribacter populi]|uniref:glycosyltransferase n=1 Tax=Litoribacter populi TaxID=2598460 RepID=UPI00117DBBF6|nr:glycosyltransferase [Litoribacter populi]
MKIAIIAHANFPIKEPYAGGLEMITYQLVVNLQKIGHQVDLYAHPDSDSSLPLVSLGDCNFPFFEEEFQPDSMGLFEQTMSAFYAKVCSKIKNGKYDLIHNHSLHYLPIILGEESEVPFITSFHTPVFTELNFALKTIQTRNQHFTAVSHKLAETYAEFVKCRVVYNGIDLGKWNLVDSNLGDYVFWYGRVCPEKGTHLAIEAARLLGKKILLAGPLSNLAYFHNKVENLIDDDQCVYLGHLNQDEVNKVLGMAEVMLFTSTWDEPYGLSIAESLACGTPVVSFDKGAAKEILTEKTGRIVKPFDIELYANAIEEASLLDRITCRKRAEEFCGVEKMMQGYLDLYNSLTISSSLIHN